MQVTSAIRISLFVAIWAAFCLTPPEVLAANQRTVLHIVGSTTVAKALLEPRRDDIRSATGIEFELQCKGTGPGLLKLANGGVDASGASETLADAIASATERAKQDRDPTVLPNNLVYSEILNERIVVIVNAKNTRIKQLSKQKLSDIFTQKIVNWEKAGGNDEYITVFVSPVGSATRALFQKIIMDGAEYPNDDVHHGGIVMPVKSTAYIIDTVAMVPDSIAVVSESALKLSPRKEGVRVVDTPIINHPLGFITVGKPSARMQQLIDYLRNLESKNE